MLHIGPHRRLGELYSAQYWIVYVQVIARHLGESLIVGVRVSCER